MATIKDVARLADVSIATVSAVINNSRPVSLRTRDRIESIIKELDYVPNQVAKSLQSGLTKNIVYIVPSLTNQIFAQYIEEVQKVLSTYDYTVNAFANQGDKTITRSYCNGLSRSNIDGVIISQGTACGEIIVSVCKNRKIPITILTTPITLESVDAVISDEAQGAALAVNHLLANGHKKIAFLMTASSSLHKSRLTGYKDALKNEGVSIASGLVIESEDHSHQGAYTSIENHIDRYGFHFSGLVCCNDYMALGAIKALRDKGIKVPENCSVVGFDNSISQYVIPSVTTIESRKRIIAQTVVENLLNQVKQGSTTNARIMYPLDLVIRESTINIVDTNPI